MRRRTGPSHRIGFTLLELLLAVAILASVFGLVASLWGQASGWNNDIERHGDVLRLQRVLAMMKDQWANRRTSVELGDKKEDVVVSHTQISFTTASPILFPDWPLVVATYRIEPERDLDRLGEWRLIYEESRIASAAVPSEAMRPSDSTRLPDRDPRGRPLRDHTVLLEGMTSARFERFGPAPKPEKSDTDADPDSEEESKDTSDRAPQLVQDDSRTRDTDDEIEDGEAPGLEDTEAEKDAKRDRWRPMEELGFTGVIPSVRIVGELDKEKFACVFVILGSR